MAAFTYKAKLPSGATTQGVIEAQELRLALEKLKLQKLVILEIQPQTQNLVETLKKLSPFRPKPTTRDLVLFSRQLSTLVSAGVPIVQGLSILEAQAENPAFREVLSKVREDIESGLSISDALKKHPRAFPELYVSMIRAGEVGGILDAILERLSSYLEAAEALRGKIKSAMMYPAVVITIAAAVTLFLIAFVIPTFKEIFSSFGAGLPYPTRVLISLSDFARKNILYILASPFVASYFLKRYYRTPDGRYRIDGYFLRMPIFGVLIRKAAIAKLTRTLGTLVKSGVPIMQAMDTVAKTSGNAVVERAMFAARESVREGERIAEPLKKSKIFPPMVTQMIAVGEETGNLDQMLSKIADFYDQEVDTAVKGLTSMIEPLVIVVMGIIIGGIVIAMFMPMFQLGELAGKQG
ncbi:MAG: type II secretion system F family protein [Elusimicrobia bacterium]|nr:type II secretion system F family protein [Elusimicrobiota bacterium]